MFRLMSALVLLAFFALVNVNAFAGTLSCKFKSDKVVGVQTIQISDESLIINKELEIPLEKSRVKCGNFGRQMRLDGRALGYQVVLKTCTSDAVMAGHLIDSVNEVAAEVLCNNI